MISDAHEGIKAAVAKVPHASWQRCRVHFTRNALAPAGRSERLNGEIKRRTDLVDEDAIICLVGAILLEQNDEWTVQRAPT